jgi:hypothetical protein
MGKMKEIFSKLKKVIYIDGANERERVRGSVEFLLKKCNRGREMSRQGTRDSF